jgi:cytoskeletal protein CcmA (bactofilin family)/DNA-directed RNA polymerase subunit RPC12/RpoP
MPPKPQDKALVACPYCGNQQLEPRAAVSSNCRQCGKYLRVQELLNPKPKEEARTPEQKRVACFDCGTEMDVPAVAKSAMCKRCSSYMDLQDYSISNAVSKNFRTKGRFVVEPKGYVFNTEVVAREIVLKGRVIGKFSAEQSLTVHSGADINGTLVTPLLLIPADTAFHWREPMQCGTVDVSGEAVGNIRASTLIRVRRGARLFGSVTAPNLVVEDGAVIVANTAIGTTVLPPEPEKPAPPMESTKPAAARPAKRKASSKASKDQPQ